MLNPMITAASDPIVIGEILASLIRSDIRTRHTVDPKVLQGLPFKEDRGRDLWLGPWQLEEHGGGDCLDWTRAEGAHWGTHIGVIRTPEGFHSFLLKYDPSAKRWTYRDVAAERGMAVPPWVTEETYLVKSVKVPIRRERTPDDKVEEVGGLWASIVGVVGTIGSAVAGAFGTPAAGAAVAVGTSFAVKAISAAEDAAAAKAAHSAAVQSAAKRKIAQAMALKEELKKHAKNTATAPADRAVATAALVALSGTPAERKRLHIRLQIPAAQDPDPAGRVLLMQGLALAGHVQEGVKVAAAEEQHKESPPTPVTEAERSTVAVEIDEDDLDDVSGFGLDDEELMSLLGRQSTVALGCPGTCGARSE